MPNATRWLDRLFSADLRVVGEETRLGNDVPEISADEAAEVKSAFIGRRIAFATGRACARRALARLDVTDFSLRNGPDRAPLWPSGIVGSITHTGAAPGGYCAVVVGRSTDLAALGVDAEQWNRLTPAIWSRVLTSTELAWVDGHRTDEARQISATVIFSAKESFYKAQYPSSGRFLNFHDVEVTVEPAHSTFQVRVLESAVHLPGFSGCEGRYLQMEEFVLTGVAIPASRAAALIGDISATPGPTPGQRPERRPPLNQPPGPPSFVEAPASLTQAGQFDQEA